jgi:hypothetical protein
MIYYHIQPEIDFGIASLGNKIISVVVGEGLVKGGCGIRVYF